MQSRESVYCGFTSEGDFGNVFGGMGESLPLFQLARKMV